AWAAACRPRCGATWRGWGIASPKASACAAAIRRWRGTRSPACSPAPANRARTDARLATGDGGERARFTRARERRVGAGARDASVLLLAGTLLCIGRPAAAQSTPAQLTPILQKKLQSPEVVTYQLEEYLLARAPRLPSP